MIHVPYKGSGPSIIDLVGGQVALMFGSTSVLPHVQTKKLILLGVSGARRSAFVPDTPTIAESGVPGYEITAWNALFAPAGTPAAIVTRLNQLVRQGLANPDTKAVMERRASTRRRARRRARRTRARRAAEMGEGDQVGGHQAGMMPRDKEAER